MAGPSPSQYNLLTDPKRQYPRFKSFKKREDWIRGALLVTYYNELETQITAQILSETDGVWLAQRAQDVEQGILPDFVNQNIDQEDDMDVDLSEDGPLHDDLSEDDSSNDDSSDDERFLSSPQSVLPSVSNSASSSEDEYMEGHNMDGSRSPSRNRERRGDLTESSEGSRDIEDSTQSSQGSRERTEESPEICHESRERREDFPESSQRMRPLSRRNSPENSQARRGRRWDSPESSRREVRRGDSPNSSQGRRDRRDDSPMSSPRQRERTWDSLASSQGGRDRNWDPDWDYPESSEGSRNRTRALPLESSQRQQSRSISPQRSNSPMTSPPRQERDPIGHVVNLIQQGGNHPTGQDLGMITQNDVFQTLFSFELEKRMQPFADLVNVYLVGDLQALPDFQPCRGDLIISRPTGRHIGLPNAAGYIASCLENGSSSYEFTQRDLVLRIGSFEPNFLGEISYKPFTRLELFVYSPRGRALWRFLGHQAELQRAITRPLDTSPGKFLQVGAPVLGPSTVFVQALMPRRGDVIIKRQAWVENFSHQQDFWYSMVKWHRDGKFNFHLGDMLVRRLVDSRLQSKIWGWAELYEFNGPGLGWIFWGRTQHLHDTPWPEKSHHIVLYEYDDGSNSDEEVLYENAKVRYMEATGIKI